VAMMLQRNLCHVTICLSDGDISWDWVVKREEKEKKKS